MKEAIDNRRLSAVCEEAARAAGRHAFNGRGRRGEVDRLFEHDIKLVMDSECQRVAEQTVFRHFPDHAVLGEEGIQAARNDWEWIIDPIDGTANYARDFPYWCSSVAVRYRGQVLAGCVYVPMVDECYTAAADSPALCNGVPIHPSEVPSLGKSMFFAGLTKDMDPRAVAYFDSMAPVTGKIRILGAAAIDICHVARGRSDGFFEAGLYRWDVAAAGLIAERAGALCSEWPRDEAHGVRFLCTNPHIHPDARHIVETHFGK